MKCGVIIFPGSNCDQDLLQVLKATTNAEVIEIWHKDTDLQGCTHLFVPGGFSYGDYLRSGAIANLAPIMESIKEHAAQGGFVFGICNGFQILCESGLLPGALLRNTNMKFNCKNVMLRVENNQTAITSATGLGEVLTIPIAHGEGRFYCDASTLDTLKQNQQIVFRYCNAQGETTEESNPNGSLENIAGICNAGHNVFGMMPHPERCASQVLGNTDGLKLFQSMVKNALEMA